MFSFIAIFLFLGILLGQQYYPWGTLNFETGDFCEILRNFWNFTKNGKMPKTECTGPKSTQIVIQTPKPFFSDFFRTKTKKKKFFKKKSFFGFFFEGDQISGKMPAGLPNVTMFTQNLKSRKNAQDKMHRSQKPPNSDPNTKTTFV